MRNLSRHSVHRAASEGGFTLPELTIVMVLMGILAAIAIPSWFGLIASKDATAAANQLTADLRLAHTQSTNRLTNVPFEVLPNGKYKVGGNVRSLPDRFKVTSTSTTMTFKSNGEVTGVATLVIRSADGTKTYYEITPNPQTSKVDVDPQ